MNTYEVTCRFCGIVTGTFDYDPQKIEAPVTLEKLGIADSRCVDCIEAHGDFKTMADIYDRDIADGYDKFTELMESCDYKLPAFVKACAFKAPERFLAVDQHDERTVQAQVERLKEDLGIQDLTPNERFSWALAIKEDHPDAEDFEKVPQQKITQIKNELLAERERLASLPQGDL